MNDKKNAESSAAPPSPAAGKHTGIKIFFSAAVLFLISFLPVLIQTGGRYHFYGDYDVQNIPMWLHFHDMYNSGVPSWDWQSGLGMNYIGSYTFYGLFSPYTLLSLLFPRSVMPFAVTGINALKFGVAALGAYLYCRQYVKKDDSAYICGMLYAFSGWQLFDLVYHFSEIVSVFPFVLLSLDKLVKERRIICFALAMAIMGITNYFFFWSTCVFLLIYFIVKTASGEYKITKKLFARLAAETLIGTGLTAFALMPSFFVLLGNKRASSSVLEVNPLAYEEQGTVWRIFQSLFFVPDNCTDGVFFSSKQLDIASVSLYIPLFTVIGVISVFTRNRKSWYSKLAVVCGIFAVIPLLNSSFSGFNSTYYGRWLFMPLLIMIMMTGKYIDDIETVSIKKELIFAGAVTAVFALFGISLILLGKTKRSDQIGFMLACAVLSLITMYCLSNKGKGGILCAANVKKIACVFCAAPLLFRCIMISSMDEFGGKNRFYTSTYNGDVAVDTADASNDYRVITSNYPNDDTPLIWGYSPAFLFNSCVTGEESDFYGLMGLTRNQSLKIGNDIMQRLHPLYSLISVKYDLYCNFLSMGGIETEPEHVMYFQKGFKQYSVQNRYIIYENTNYIPMGFTYDHYLPISKADPSGYYDASSPINAADILMSGIPMDEDGEKKDELIKNDPEQRGALMVKALWLTKAQIEKYGGLMDELTDEQILDTSYETYVEDCARRRQSAGYEFTPDKSGFTSKIVLPNDNLVFYSVPYDDNFTAYVDGQKTGIEKVFGGLSAVFVPAGDHTVRFEYTVRGLKEGIAVTAAAGGALIMYIIVSAIIKSKSKK